MRQDDLLEPPTSLFSSYCALRLLVIPASANIPYLRPGHEEAAIGLGLEFRGYGCGLGEALACSAKRNP